MKIVYENEKENFCLTDEQLQACGYYLKEGIPWSKTKYWVSENSDKVLAVVDSEIAFGCNVLIVSKELCEKIGWRSICLREKGGILTPYCNLMVSGDCRKVDLHVILMPDLPEGMQRDHIFHNRLVVLSEAIRQCTAVQNGYNKKNRQIKCSGNEGDYYFKCRVSTPKDMDVWKEKGFSIKKIGRCKDGTPTYDVKSQPYASKSECQAEIDSFEERVFGEFRYKEEDDFSESIGLLVKRFILEKSQKG